MSLCAASVSAASLAVRSRTSSLSPVPPPQTTLSPTNAAPLPPRPSPPPPRAPRRAPPAAELLPAAAGGVSLSKAPVAFARDAVRASISAWIASTSRNSRPPPPSSLLSSASSARASSELTSSSASGSAARDADGLPLRAAAGDDSRRRAPSVTPPLARWLPPAVNGGVRRRPELAVAEDCRCVTVASASSLLSRRVPPRDAVNSSRRFSHAFSRWAVCSSLSSRVSNALGPRPISRLAPSPWAAVAPSSTSASPFACATAAAAAAAAPSSRREVPERACPQRAPPPGRASDASSACPPSASACWARRCAYIPAPSSAEERARLSPSASAAVAVA